jgi:hypothetical protein
LSRYCCKVLSPQLFKISKMTARSAKSVFDFLHLMGELAENFGRVECFNFWEGSAIGAEFWLSEDRLASISSRSAPSVSKLRSQFLHLLPKKFFFTFGVTELYM